jgi:hypothetical protein
MAAMRRRLETASAAATEAAGISGIVLIMRRSETQKPQLSTQITEQAMICNGAQPVETI